MADILHNDSFDYQATWLRVRETQYRPQHHRRARWRNAAAGREAARCADLTGSQSRSGLLTPLSMRAWR